MAFATIEGWRKSPKAAMHKPRVGAFLNFLSLPPPKSFEWMRLRLALMSAADEEEVVVELCGGRSLFPTPNSLGLFVSRSTRTCFWSKAHMSDKVATAKVW